MNNKIANIFEEVSILFEISGENKFKCIAYSNAAKTIRVLNESVETLLNKGELQHIKGIGKSILQNISEIIESGELFLHKELKEKFPNSILELLKVQGVGPKKIKTLYDKLNIASIDGLKIACEKNLIANLDGFGEKTQQNFLSAISSLSKNIDKHLYCDALNSAEIILNFLKTQKEVEQVEIAGSIRRKKEIIGDIDILVSAKEIHREKIFNLFTQHEFVEKILSKGETKSSVILKSQIQCDMRIVNESQFPFALNYFTGSKEHNVEMRSRAKKIGLSLNEYEFSLLDKKNKLPSCKTEKDIYKILNLNYIPSELRENFGEFDFFENNTIELVDETMLKGTFHCHTNFSDGKNSLEDMVEKAKSLGFLYFGIADHSKVAVYANGLDEKRVIEQHKKIDELNFKQSKIKILKGTEVDILRDGSLDFSDEILSKFDYVVASVHSSFKMLKSEMTNRIVKALKNKYVSILGHPTGRLLLERDEYEVDMNEIINVASDFGKSIEINSHPLRLDLDWRFCRYAKEKNVKIAINPDAHSIFDIDNVKYGVSIARKGWLEKKDIINCWQLDEVEKFFSNQKC